MTALSRLPLVPGLHRLAMFLICRSGSNSERLYNVYRRVWRRLGHVQRRVTDSGTVIDCDLRDRIPETIFHFGHWEPNISFWISRRLQAGRLFIDVGSNLGYYTLIASKIVGSTGGVVAIEASPRIFTQLNRSVSVNSCANVRTVNAAVADRPGRLTVYAGPDTNSGATSTLADWRHGKAEAEVVALPLDQILTTDELGRVRLIKIDVEGAEAPILLQIGQSIDKYPRDVEVLVECSAGDDRAVWERIFAQFSNNGFRAFHIANEYSTNWYLNWRTPCRLQKINAVPSGQTDVLFSREEIID